jgi:DNA-binding MarR family transcriptional regulator
VTGHDGHIRRILDHLDAGTPVSQRSLSGELGIALGLTNLLVRRMMRQGWVRLVRVPPNRYRYFLTPAGLAQKARLSRDYLAQSVQFYTETRDRIRKTFDAVSRNWEQIVGAGAKHVVFFSRGEIAEIGYLCVHETDLTLTGVIDNDRRGPFFHVPVHPVAALRNTQLAGEPFGVVIVMSLGDTADVQGILAERGVPPDRVVWLV